MSEDGAEHGEQRQTFSWLVCTEFKDPAPADDANINIIAETWGHVPATSREQHVGTRGDGLSNSANTVKGICALWAPSSDCGVPLRAHKETAAVESHHTAAGDGGSERQTASL